MFAKNPTVICHDCHFSPKTLASFNYLPYLCGKKLKREAI